MNSCGTLGINVVLTVPSSGRLRAAAKNLVKLSPRNLTSRPARSSSTNVTPPAVPTPGIAGGGEAKDGSRRQAPEFLVQTRLDGLKLFSLALALIPGLQTNPKETVVTGPYIAKQTETNHAGGVLDARCTCENLLHLCRSRAGAFLRSRVGKLHVDV